jgi:hypothetical protein
VSPVLAPKSSPEGSPASGANWGDFAFQKQPYWNILQLFFEQLNFILN